MIIYSPTKTRILRFIAKIMGVDCIVVPKGTFPPRPSKKEEKLYHVLESSKFKDSMKNAFNKLVINGYISEGEKVSFYEVKDDSEEKLS